MFKIYRSSAGSGKTYTLAQDYVALALLRPDYFKHILAVTFTNKATQEMKERILGFMHVLAKGKSDDIAQNMMDRLNLNEEELRHRAESGLQMMLHQYGSLSIKTIDAFFQQVLRSFTRELGLRGDFELELDTAKVEDAAIDMLLQEVGKDTWLTDWLVEYVMERVDEGKNYNVVSSIKELASELHKEKISPHLQVLFELAKHPGAIREFRKKVLQDRQALHEEAVGLGVLALEKIEEAGFTVGDFFYGKSGVHNAFVKWAGGKLDDISTGSRVKNAYNGEWTKKNQSNKDDVDAFAEAHLHPILGSMLEFCVGKLLIYHSLSCISKNLYVFGIMLKLMAKINQYKQDEDVLLLADTPGLIRQIIGDNQAPYIYEKVGTRFQHYLMDEFQDTSGLQWANMRPLVEESLASQPEELQGMKEAMGLIVGDVKQSIYRWRGGDWELLLEKIQKDLRVDSRDIKNLNINWRSLTNVITFNNVLFEHYPKHLQALIEGDAGKHADIIAKAYASVDQIISSKAKVNTNQGLVRFTFFDAKEESEEGEVIKWRERIPEQLIAVLHEAQDAGFALRDIAILVRSNRDGNALIQFLQQYVAEQAIDHPYKYDVVSKEALALGDAPVIQCLTRAMELLQTPDNNLIKVSLASAYTRIHPQLATATMLSPQASWELLPESFTQAIPVLRSLSLFELAERLMLIFELRIEGQLAYLQAFEDAVLDFQRNQVADLASFLEWWKERGRSKSVMISDEQDAIKVLSIHKSKGLQFPVVILPYVDWALDNMTGGGKGPILWTQEAPNDYFQTELNGKTIQMPFPIKYSSQLLGTWFADAYSLERVQAAMDALNMLYVATTRAESVLIGFAPKPALRKDGTELEPKNVGQLLFQTLREHLPNELGEEKWERGLWEKPSATDDSSKSNKLPLSTFTIQPWQEKLKIKSRHHRLVYSGKAVERITYGNLIHDLLANVRHASDMDRAINRMQMEGRISAKQKTEIQSVWQEMLDYPMVKDWFTNTMDVRNEQSILTPSGEAYRPDRVMIQDTCAVVIDFKTGEAYPRHIAQLQGYMNILKEMGYFPIEGYLLYTDTMEIQPVTLED